LNFARLNHILIPTTREKRERYRKSRIGRLLRPVSWFYNVFSSEGRALLLLSLFVGTAAAEVDRTQTYYLWSVLFGVLLVAVFIRIGFRLRQVSAEALAPPRVAVGEATQFVLKLHNDSERDYHNIRVGRPFLPWDGKWQGAPPVVATLRAGETKYCEARAHFIQRGEHHLDTFSAAIVAPLGLSMGPKLQSGGCHFTVVPRIANVERVQIPVGTRYQPGGVAQASMTGEAMELRGVRPYRAGDPIRDLHPRTWARVGLPHVREYQQEYFSRVGVIVDNDNEALSEHALEAAVSLAAGVIATLSRGQALVDLLVVGDNVHAFTLGRSLGFLDQALDLLAVAQPGEPLDVESLVPRLEPYLSRLSALVLITGAEVSVRVALADAIEQRGVRCRILRVADDKQPFWRREPADMDQADPREQVIAVSSIQNEEPLSC
jgi:uncharacterized protein (DUF58 family)